MNWPLAVSNFTLVDKLKIGWWLVKENHWSQGDWVWYYEKKWEQYTGAPHAIMVSSGSAANHLLAFRRKWELQQAGKWPKCNQVIFPVVNWISAVSPWILLGFKPIFIDVTSNLCSSGDQVAKALEKNKNVAAVFYTSLLGLDGDLARVRHICDEWEVPLFLDNCESSFSLTPAHRYPSEGLTHICNVVPCSTSFYFSHHTSGNQEGGMIFCQSINEANFYRMARNHGMTRDMPSFYKNPDADPRFDFYLLGSNHRSSNLIAYMALLDFDRARKFSRQRQLLALSFAHHLDEHKFDKAHRLLNYGIPLAIPIVAKELETMLKVKQYLKQNGIEFRPIVGGNLLRHTAFKGYGDPRDFPKAEHIHNCGIYIGLHPGVTAQMVNELTSALNSL